MPYVGLVPLFQKTSRHRSIIAVVRIAAAVTAAAADEQKDVIKIGPN